MARRRARRRLRRAHKAEARREQKAEKQRAREAEKRPERRAAAPLRPVEVEPVGIDEPTDAGEHGTAVAPPAPTGNPAQQLAAAVRAGRKPRRPHRALNALFVVALLGILGTTAWFWRQQDGEDFTAGASEAVDLPATTAPEPTVVVEPTTAAPITLPPVLRTPSPEDPLRVWFLGDSTAWAVGTGLDAIDSEGRLALNLKYHTSTGLARPDVFDWNNVVGFIQDTNPPEAMLISLGANDGQPLVDPAGTPIQDVYSDPWFAEYERRIEEMTKRVIEKGTRLYWIGQPISSDPEFDQFAQRLNSVLADVAANYDDVVFVDIYHLFADEGGNYVESILGTDGITRVVRRSDGIHLTGDGGLHAAPVIYGALQTDWERAGG